MAWRQRFACLLWAGVFFLLSVQVASKAWADDIENLPRFASVGSNKVNVRQGPGREYSIKYRYTQKGYPIKIIAEADDWRLVQDADGDSGWILTNLISPRQMLLVRGDGESERPVALRAGPGETHNILAVVEPGVLLALEECRGAWCRIERKHGGRKLDGWVHLSLVWGGQLDD